MGCVIHEGVYTNNKCPDQPAHPHIDQDLCLISMQCLGLCSKRKTIFIRHSQHYVSRIFFFFFSLVFVPPFRYSMFKHLAFTYSGFTNILKWLILEPSYNKPNNMRNTFVHSGLYTCKVYSWQAPFANLSVSKSVSCRFHPYIHSQRAAEDKSKWSQIIS